jgi:probable F420-dependent oxidoreductase
MTALGVRLRSVGNLPVEPGLTEMARRAEELGAASLWFSDHLLMLRRFDSMYPFAPDGVAPWTPDTPWWEAMTCCAFAAAATTRCRIGTSVLILPQRNPLELAKTAATLDRLSGGRLALGVGAGWLVEEIEALGFDPRGRGRRLDEGIEALRRCWTGAPEPFAGEQIVLRDGLVFEPRPERPEGPPILVGGMGQRSLRRAAEAADGWMAFTRQDQFDGTALARARERLLELRGRGSRAGRPFELLLRISPAPGARDDALPALVAEAARIGFDEVIIDPDFTDEAAATRLIERSKDAART